MCKENGVDFMEFRVWIGFWTAVLLILIVMFNLSFMVKYITRFTEDCFATLVAIIFIIDALKSTANLRKPASSSGKLPSPHTSTFLNNETLLFGNNEDESNLTAFGGETTTTTTPIIATSTKSQVELDYLKASNDAVFFFSVLLFIFTFFVCMTLKAFRNKPFLPSKVRSLSQ
jgi:hypothetical protein